MPFGVANINARASRLGVVGHYSSYLKCLFFSPQPPRLVWIVPSRLTRTISPLKSDKLFSAVLAPEGEYTKPARRLPRPAPALTLQIFHTAGGHAVLEAPIQPRHERFLVLPHSLIHPLQVSMALTVAYSPARLLLELRSRAICH